MSSQAPNHNFAPQLPPTIRPVKFSFSPELPKSVPELKLDQPKSTAWFSNDTSLSEKDIQHFVRKLHTPGITSPKDPQTPQRDSALVVSTVPTAEEEAGKYKKTMDAAITKMNGPLHMLMRSGNATMNAQHANNLVPSSTVIVSQPKTAIHLLEEKRKPLATSTSNVVIYGVGLTSGEVEHDEESGGVYIGPPEVGNDGDAEWEPEQLKIIEAFVNKVKSQRR